MGGQAGPDGGEEGDGSDRRWAGRRGSRARPRRPRWPSPPTGSLKGTAPWDELARANVRRIQGGHIPDLSVLTMAFRDWAAAKNLPLDAPRIEQTFVGFCKAYSARAQ